MLSYFRTTMVSSVFLRISLVLLIGTCLVSGSEGASAAMSVDLGSQYIKIGVVKSGVPMDIVLNKESRRKTPNVISFRNGERLFAEAAAALATKHPKSAYQYILAQLGKQSGHSAVELYKQRFPFAAITFDETRDTVIFPTESEAYNVETLLAMILWSARQNAEAFIDHIVKDVVITIPVFFNQAERRALRAAADIAGLNLLQLLSEGSAAALNYGVFRRKEITEKPQTLLIYDMGATKTTVTIVQYVLEAEMNKGIKNPVIRTIGVGFDRTLGGLEVTTRIAKYLERIFRETVKTTNDIATNARSMVKLHREAEHVKKILSANKDTFAQVENLHEEQDFRAKLTREEVEKLIVDLEQRFRQPIADALIMAEKKIEEIDNFVLMGAGTRLPKLQEILKGILGDKEIGRFLNTDEAIALGAVYQAAHLSNSLKVLPFGVQELILFPVQVDFKSKTKNGDLKDVTRTVFRYKTHYPTSNKIVNLQSFTEDFILSVNYGEVAHLNDQQKLDLGKSSISSVSIVGVGDAIKKKVINDYTEFKGVKVSFFIDLSGIVDISKADVFVEKKPTPEDLTKYDSDRKTYNIYLDVVKTQKDEKKKLGNDTAENSTETAKEDQNMHEVYKPSEPKTATIKIPLTVNVTLNDLPDMTEESKISAKELLAAFEIVERKKLEREAAMNALESKLYDLPIKLEDEEFLQIITEHEKNKILYEVQIRRLWLEDDVTAATTTEQFKENKKILDDLFSEAIKKRNDRINDMPEAIANLEREFDYARLFYETAKSLAETEEPLLTPTELDALEKLIKTTERWFDEKPSEYKNQANYEEPVITAADVNEKASGLKRKVDYLVNKAKNFESKKTVEMNNETKESNKTEGGVGKEQSTAKETRADQAEWTTEKGKIRDVSEL